MQQAIVPTRYNDSSMGSYIAPVRGDEQNSSDRTALVGIDTLDRYAASSTATAAYFISMAQEM